MSTAAFRKPPTIGHRFADLKPESYDAKARTFEAVLSTSTPVRRDHGDEVLLNTPATVNLERMETCGIPLIDSHIIFSIGGVFGGLRRVWFETGAMIGLLGFDDSENGRNAEGLVSRGAVRG